LLVRGRQPRGGDDSGPLGDAIVARVDPARPPAKGERVHLRIQPGKEHLFSPSTGRRIPA